MGPAGLGGVDLSLSVENEWLCSRLLTAFGIPCAPCELRTFGEQRVLVVERFDRQWRDGRSWIARLPQEDFCQATATPPWLKYESDGGPGILEIAHILTGSTRREDREDFFRTQVLFWLLCAIDGHAKNFSIFIEAGGGYRLTPRYDVLSAYPVLGRRVDQLAPQKVKMAMAVFGKGRHYRWRDFHADHWLETARRCGLSRGGRELIEELLERAELAVSTVEREVPRGFPEEVSAPIFEGVRKASRKLRAQLA